MTLNFPDSPSTGDTYTDSTSGFSYEWNGTVWISTDPQRAANIKELDDISSGFNGSTTQFNLTVSSSAVSPVSDAQVLISVGGVMQNPTNDYTVSGSTITFTTAPSAGLTFFGVFLGQALSLNTIQDGTVEFASFKTGTAGVGIQSAGSQIGVGITNLNFIGTGNTFVAIGNTVNVSVNVGGIDTTGTSYFNNITASGNLNVTGDLTYDEVTAVNQKISGVTTTTGLDVLGISSVKDLRSVGVTTLTSAGITNLTVSAGSTFNGNVDLGNATSDTITATGRFDSDIVPSTDNARDLGASGLEFKDLYIDGTANIDSLAADTAAIGDLTDNRVVIAGSSGELEDDANFTFDGSKLNIGVGVATIGVNGNAAFAGIVTVGGNLYVTGDIHYDEVTGRNLNISGIATFAKIGSNLIPDPDGTRNIGAATSEWGDLFIDGTANIDALVADTAQVSDLTNTRVVYAGASGELSDDSTLTFNSTTKVLSVQELVGVHTSAGGGGVGIASTTAHVGYGFTYIQFKGPGVSTVYASSTTGIATIFFQGGGLAGAAGTWSPEGSIGVSTSKSVGVNTTSLSDADLQGIGNTFQGLYIGNGMVVTDNQLNGNHYIGTAYNGLMAGPVTVNGVLTVDGNWAVV